jgi:beta-carotene 15,15'-dioxygenase
MTIQKASLLKHAGWLVPALIALAWLERQWPMLVLVVFVLLTLSLGFAHGAMDILLLRDSRGQLDQKKAAIYALAAGLLALALAAWPGVALITLILLSLWHFGEQAHFEHANQPVAWLLRLVQGGSSVMLPVLLSPNALQPWVKSIAAEHAFWVWSVWVAMAALWCALLLAAFVLIKPWQSGVHQTLWLELAALIVLNLLLSPLLAFALFFGLYHSGAHVWRMLRLQRRDGKPLDQKLWMATLGLTWLALAGLWWWMPTPALTSEDAGKWLRWLVVALTAVTLPHLVLIYRARNSLFV